MWEKRPFFEPLILGILTGMVSVAAHRSIAVAQAVPGPAQFSRGGYNYAVEPSLGDHRIAVRVSARSSAVSSSKSDELRFEFDRKGLSITRTSAAGRRDMVTIAPTGDKDRVSVTYINSDGSKRATSGSSREVIAFLQPFDAKTSLPPFNFSKDPQLRAMVFSSIHDRIEESKRRARARREQWEKAWKEIVKNNPFLAASSFCDDMATGCRNGGDWACIGHAACMLAAWLCDGVC